MSWRSRCGHRCKRPPRIPRLQERLARKFPSRNSQFRQDTSTAFDKLRKEVLPPRELQRAQITPLQSVNPRICNELSETRIDSGITHNIRSCIFRINDEKTIHSIKMRLLHIIHTINTVFQMSYSIKFSI